MRRECDGHTGRWGAECHEGSGSWSTMRTAMPCQARLSPAGPAPTTSTCDTPYAWASTLALRLIPAPRLGPGRGIWPDPVEPR